MSSPLRTPTLTPIGPVDGVGLALGQGVVSLVLVTRQTRKTLWVCPNGAETPLWRDESVSTRVLSLLLNDLA